MVSNAKGSFEATEEARSQMDLTEFAKFSGDCGLLDVIDTSQLKQVFRNSIAAGEGTRRDTLNVSEFEAAAVAALNLAVERCSRTRRLHSDGMRLLQLQCPGVWDRAAAARSVRPQASPAGRSPARSRSPARGQDALKALAQPEEEEEDEHQKHAMQLGEQLQGLLEDAASARDEEAPGPGPEEWLGGGECSNLHEANQRVAALREILWMQRDSEQAREAYLMTHPTPIRAKESPWGPRQIVRSPLMDEPAEAVAYRESLQTEEEKAACKAMQELQDQLGACRQENLELRELVTTLMAENTDLRHTNSGLQEMLAKMVPKEDKVTEDIACSYNAKFG